MAGLALSHAAAPGLEKQYTEMLAALRAEIGKLVPKIDDEKLAAFRKAYASEALTQSAHEASLKGKAHIGSTDATAKEEAAKADRDIADAYAKAQTNTLAVAAPILSELEELLASDALDVRLVKCAVLANATPSGLVKFAQQGKAEEALVAKLLADDELMKQMVMADGARDGNYGRAIQIYSEIQQASRRADEGILQRLALGTSLEQASPGIKTKGKFDSVRRYLHYEKAFLNGELDPAFKNMTTWECRMITDAPEADEDLAWGREMLRNYRPDIIFEPDYRWRYCKIVRTDVPYKNPELTNDGTSKMQQFLNGGGKCGPRAFVGRFALRAFGIPTWGVTQPGHAALAHWTSAGWTINLGADWKFSWWENRPGTDFHLESQARAYPKDYVKVLRAQWIGDALGEQKVNPKQPGTGGLWNALALAQKKAIVAAAKPVAVALAGEELAEATESTKAEAIVALKIADEDKKIVTDRNGVITIPAAACSKPKNNTKTIVFMKSFAGGMQMCYQKDEAFEYTFESPTAGKYELTVRVVTVHRNQQLNLAANDDKMLTIIPLPYTIGTWGETQPVLITLVKGVNVLHFIGTKESLGMTLKDFTLKPARQNAGLKAN